MLQSIYVAILGAAALTSPSFSLPHSIKARSTPAGRDRIVFPDDTDVSLDVRYGSGHKFRLPEASTTVSTLDAALQELEAQLQSSDGIEGLKKLDQIPSSGYGSPAGSQTADGQQKITDDSLAHNGQVAEPVRLGSQDTHGSYGGQKPVNSGLEFGTTQALEGQQPVTDFGSTANFGQGQVTEPLEFGGQPSHGSYGGQKTVGSALELGSQAAGGQRPDSDYGRATNTGPGRVVSSAGLGSQGGFGGQKPVTEIEFGSQTSHGSYGGQETVNSGLEFGSEGQHSVDDYDHTTNLDQGQKIEPLEIGSQTHGNYGGQKTIDSAFELGSQTIDNGVSSSGINSQGTRGSSYGGQKPATSGLEFGSTDGQQIVADYDSPTSIGGGKVSQATHGSYGQKAVNSEFELGSQSTDGQQIETDYDSPTSGGRRQETHTSHGSYGGQKAVNSEFEFGSQSTDGQQIETNYYPPTSSGGRRQETQISHGNYGGQRAVNSEFEFGSQSTDGQQIETDYYPPTSSGGRRQETQISHGNYGGQRAVNSEFEFGSQSTDGQQIETDYYPPTSSGGRRQETQISHGNYGGQKAVNPEFEFGSQSIGGQQVVTDYNSPTSGGRGESSLTAQGSYGGQKTVSEVEFGSGSGQQPVTNIGRPTFGEEVVSSYGGERGQGETGFWSGSSHVNEQHPGGINQAEISQIESVLDYLEKQLGTYRPSEGGNTGPVLGTGSIKPGSASGRPSYGGGGLGVGQAPGSVEHSHPDSGGRVHSHSHHSNFHQQTITSSGSGGYGQQRPSHQVTVERHSVGRDSHDPHRCTNPDHRHHHHNEERTVGGQVDTVGSRRPLGGHHVHTEGEFLGGSQSPSYGSSGSVRPSSVSSGAAIFRGESNFEEQTSFGGGSRPSGGENSGGPVRPPLGGSGTFYENPIYEEQTSFGGASRPVGGTSRPSYGGGTGRPSYGSSDRTIYREESFNEGLVPQSSFGGSSRPIGGTRPSYGGSGSGRPVYGSGSGGVHNSEEQSLLGGGSRQVGGVSRPSGTNFNEHTQIERHSSLGGGSRPFEAGSYNSPGSISSGDSIFRGDSQTEQGSFSSRPISSFGGASGRPSYGGGRVTVNEQSSFGDSSRPGGVPSRPSYGSKPSQGSGFGAFNEESLITEQSSFGGGSLPVNREFSPVGSEDVHGGGPSIGGSQFEEHSFAGGSARPLGGSGGSYGVSGTLPARGSSGGSVFEEQSRFEESHTSFSGSSRPISGSSRPGSGSSGGGYGRPSRESSGGAAFNQEFHSESQSSFGGGTRPSGGFSRPGSGVSGSGRPSYGGRGGHVTGSEGAHSEQSSFGGGASPSRPSYGGTSGGGTSFREEHHVERHSVIGGHKPVSEVTHSVYGGSGSSHGSSRGEQMPEEGYQVEDMTLISAGPSYGDSRPEPASSPPKPAFGRQTTQQSSRYFSKTSTSSIQQRTATEQNSEEQPLRFYTELSRDKSEESNRSEKDGSSEEEEPQADEAVVSRTYAGQLGRGASSQRQKDISDLLDELDRQGPGKTSHRTGVVPVELAPRGEAYTTPPPSSSNDGFWSKLGQSINKAIG